MPSLSPAIAAVVERLVQIDARLNELDREHGPIEEARALGHEADDLAHTILAHQPASAADALAIATILASQVDGFDPEDERSSASIERGLDSLIGHLERVGGMRSETLGLGAYYRPRREREARRRGATYAKPHPGPWAAHRKALRP